MSEQQSESELTQAVESLALTEFLETIPPPQIRKVSTKIEKISVDPSSRVRLRFVYPDIQLHCPGSNCNGPRFFRAQNDECVVFGKLWNHEFITYVCGNCQTRLKTYALVIFVQTDESHVPIEIRCYKFGENPPYGPPTPSRLISLIGPDRELFLKGRRSENQGLGIGAFGYYRRVVENQKNRIIEEIIKVAESLSMSPDTIAELRNAQKENQFSKAVQSIKAAIPQRLLITGENPLLLLHTALSRGLHGQTDEKCLELAQYIRLILVELSELLGQALKDERELKEAVSRLLSSPP